MYVCKTDDKKQNRRRLFFLETYVGEEVLQNRRHVLLFGTRDVIVWSVKVFTYTEYIYVYMFILNDYVSCTSLLQKRRHRLEKPLAITTPWCLTHTTNTQQHTTTHYKHTTTHNNPLQTHNSTQQHTTPHNNTPQHTATHNNTQQHTATHNNTLQRTKTYCKRVQESARECKIGYLLLPPQM